MPYDSIDWNKARWGCSCPWLAWRLVGWLLCKQVRQRLCPMPCDTIQWHKARWGAALLWIACLWSAAVQAACSRSWETVQGRALPCFGRPLGALRRHWSSHRLCACAMPGGEDFLEAVQQPSEFDCLPCACDSTACNCLSLAQEPVRKGGPVLPAPTDPGRAVVSWPTALAALAALAAHTWRAAPPVPVAFFCNVLSWSPLVFRWSLHKFGEPLLLGSRLRKRALAECMKHIHYEVSFEWD